MATEPKLKRAITFIDGQNLYHVARTAFANVTHPNYDVMKISQEVCKYHGWVLSNARFYTGYPEAKDDPFWNNFWQKKLLAIGRQGVTKYTRHLRYREKVFKVDDSTEIRRFVGEEKGIDVRIAIDLIRLALDERYDVAVIFSQDQDLSEAVDEIKKISMKQNRWIKVACAFPDGPRSNNHRGINGCEWFRMTEEFYSRCVDPSDYR